MNVNVSVNCVICGNGGERLDIVKFPRIIAGESEGARESGSTVIPGIPLIWSYMPCFMD